MELVDVCKAGSDIHGYQKKKKSYFTGIDGIFSSHLSFVFYALPINNISQF